VGAYLYAAVGSIPTTRLEGQQAPVGEGLRRLADAEIIEECRSRIDVAVPTPARQVPRARSRFA
jgi:hypothetical protein